MAAAQKSSEMQGGCSGERIKVLEQGLTSALLLTNPPTLPFTCTCPLAPPPSGVLLCCQITKWLFACYKQRKQILYRYYIYIEMFFPRWEVCIGTDIALIHTLRQYSFKAPRSYIRLHVHCC